MAIKDLSKIIKLVQNFLPTQGQANELRSKAEIENNAIPASLPVMDNISADINNIKNIPELSDEERNNYQPTAQEQLSAGMTPNTDNTLQKMNANDIVTALSEGKNLGSPTLDNILKQMATKQMGGEITGAAAEPIDEKKAIFDQLVKKELENLNTPMQNPVASPMDIASAWKKGGWQQGVGKLGEYLNTAQGQNVMGALMGALGNKNMVTAYARGANRQRPIEQQQMENAQEAEREKAQDREQLVKSYITSTSPKSGASFKNVIDIYHDQKLISDTDYAKLQSNNSYINDDSFSPSTINKLIEPYLISKRQGGAINLEELKQGGRKELQGLGHGNRLEEIQFSKSTPQAQTPEQTAHTKASTKKLENEIQLGGTQGAVKGIEAVNKQINNFTNQFDVMPAKKALAGTALRQVSGTQTAGEASFMSQRTLLFNKIARDLGGEKGVLSDADIKRVEASLPTLYDSKEQKLAKIKAVRQLIDIRMEQYGKKIPSVSQTQPTIKQGQKIGRFEVVKVSK